MSTTTSHSHSGGPTSAAAALAAGDQLRFHPTHATGTRWWTVRARNDRYVVATCSTPFTRDELSYTILDTDQMARSSLNTLGGGFDIGERGQHCDEILTALQEGWELSRRRRVTVEHLELRGDRQPGHTPQGQPV